MAKLREWQDEQIEKHGWYIHFVQDDTEQSPTGANHHTHGLEENFDHPDLQIVAPIPPAAVQAVFNILVQRIKDGSEFKHGDVAKDVINGYNVLFHISYEGDRHVLRVIIPDVKNNLGRDMEGGLACQYDDL